MKNTGIGFMLRAYLSVESVCGEPESKQILGKAKSWHTRVMEARSEESTDILLTQRILFIIPLTSPMLSDDDTKGAEPLSTVGNRQQKNKVNIRVRK